MNPESFEKTKQNFLEKNARLVKAVENMTIDNHKSLKQKLHAFLITCSGN